MNRAEALADLQAAIVVLSDEDLQVLGWMGKRLASGERLTPGRDGISTARELAENTADLAVDRIGGLLRHGPGAVVSPSRISAPPERGGRDGRR